PALEIDGHEALERREQPREPYRLVERVALRVALAGGRGDAEACRPDRREALGCERRAGHGVPRVGQQQRLAPLVQCGDRAHANARARCSPGQRRGPSPNGRPSRLTWTISPACMRLVVFTGRFSPRISAAVASHAWTRIATRWALSASGSLFSKRWSPPSAPGASV